MYFKKKIDMKMKWKLNSLNENTTTTKTQQNSSRRGCEGRGDKMGEGETRKGVKVADKNLSSPACL